MKKIYTVAKYAKSIMLAAVMTASALTTVNAQEADNTTYAPAEANSWWRGEEVTGEEQQVYVYNVGAGIFVTTDDTPSEKNIDNAALWTLSNNQFSCGDYHINMWSDLGMGSNMAYSYKHKRCHYIQSDSKEYRKQRIFVQVIQEGWFSYMLFQR